jgi:hypothetical protein
MKGARETKRANNPQPIHACGLDLVWEKRHPIHVDWRKENKGLSVSVWTSPGRTRELILDVHFQGFGTDHMPNADRWNQILEMAIQSAIDAGWDPLSRGAAFRHVAGNDV